jgi:hypothetical protein
MQALYAVCTKELITIEMEAMLSNHKMRREKGFIYIRIRKGEYCSLLDELYRPGTGTRLSEKLIKECNYKFRCYLLEQLKIERRLRAAAI